ncbi:MAG: translation initiation factor eIF-2B [Candidatus Nanohaloarchaea archaeon]|nr:translation initiation factor eIF-2B [Candidatus Nanohaloarchaea archaeon]
MDPDEVIEKIETVDIQGATSVARAGIELLQSMEEEGRSEEEIAAVEARLRDARPTEPLLFNALDAADAMGYDAVLDHIEEAQATIADRAAGLVHDGDVIYTHCHSSTVTSALRTAAEDTGFSVHVTETRPLYQGRETARELADAGIPVELYVDAGARLALEEADRMMIGADAVTVEGTVINKIGSELFAEAAADRGVPVTVLTDAWKVDPRSRFGYSERLEERAAAEVWEDPPDGVDVVNYAFERVAPGAVDSIVSELGRHEPNAFMDAAHEAYPEVL